MYNVTKHFLIRDRKQDPTQQKETAIQEEEKLVINLKSNFHTSLKILEEENNNRCEKLLKSAGDQSSHGLHELVAAEVEGTKSRVLLIS